MSPKSIVFILFICLVSEIRGQFLDRISPVFLTRGTLPDSVSFILTATDFNAFQGKKADYPSSLQIVDGAQPWPPRWFATAPFGLDASETSIEPLVKPLIDAAWQGGKMTVHSILTKREKNGQLSSREAIIILDQNLEMVDSFIYPAKGADTHDFRSRPDGEKIFFERCDTILDMSAVFKNHSDSAVKLSYQNIKIVDAGNNTLFLWNPLYHFRLTDMFLPYRYTPGIMNADKSVDWSHGSSLCWDEDGNILYSYKHIGIGKISVADGHIMWQVSRNHQRPNEGSDSIPIFMQHDFKSFKNNNGKTIYTVLSNGDSSRPFTTAYQFTVQDADKKSPRFQLMRKVIPQPLVPNTGAGGNYDVEPNGDYLINYGAFAGDSAVNRLLFEFRDSHDSLIAQYKVPPRIICYRVHKMNNGHIHRPVVRENNGSLTTDNEGKEHTWYLLTGPEKTTATKVGNGNHFQPIESGDYCVTEAMGAGYAVSLPFSFIK